MAESFPTINGYEYSFSSVELRWRDKRYTGFKSINYKHSRDVGFAEGSPTQPLGLTRGSYGGVEGDLELLRKTFNAMVEDMGEGYLEQVFDILVTFAEKGQATCTDELRGITLTEESFDNARGADATTVKRSIKGLMLLPNGVKPLANMLE